MKFRNLLFLSAFAFTGLHAQNCDVGNDSAFGSSISLVSNLAYAIKFTVASPGTLTAISVMPGSPQVNGVNVKMAVYTDNAGQPGSLFASTGAVPFSGLVATATVTPVAISPGDYHVVGIIDNNAAVAYNPSSPLTLYGYSMPFVNSFPSTGASFTQTPGYAVNIWMSITCISSGMEQDVYADAAAVFPNPAADRFSIALHAQKSSAVLVEIYDACGLLLAETPVSLSPGNSTVELPLQEYARGLYFIRVSENGGLVYEGKIVKE